MSALHAVLRWLERALAAALLAGIRLYQLTLSPLMGSSCRFEPSCSRYTIEAIRAHGPVRGAWLGAQRIARCQPLCAGGFDPVPAPMTRER